MTSPLKHAILIVDDEPDVLFSLSALLRRDFDVFTAASGAEALSIMAEHSVAVIMTDQRMPLMTGTELMQRVRCKHPESIRIIFTGYADTRAVVDAINDGELYRYITKPWDPDDLVGVIREAAQRYEAMAAQAEIIEQLADYLDNASTLLSATDPTSLKTDLLDAFNAQTEELRSKLKCVQANAAEQHNDRA